MTGYTAGPDALKAVADFVKELKDENSDLIYLLDPVLGDAGRLYVSPDNIPVYRSMLPLASAITPNWFEVETLTDVKLNDLGSLQKALTILHQDYKVPNVVISSIPLTPWLADVIPSDVKPADGQAVDQYLLCLASSSHRGASPALVHAQCVPLIPGYFSGVGDLFSALFLAHFDPSIEPSPEETPASHAASYALAKTHAILRLTEEHASLLPQDERTQTDDELDHEKPLRKAKRMRGRELRLVQGQDIIRQLSLKAGDIGPLAPWSRFW